MRSIDSREVGKLGACGQDFLALVSLKIDMIVMTTLMMMMMSTTNI